jgi:prevent-host-death family protein
MLSCDHKEAPMTNLTVGVRELKSRLSEYLRQVKAGRTIVITDRGQAIGRIVPIGQSLEEKLEGMRQAGLIEWSGNRLKPMKPVARVRQGYSVSKLLIEDRR